MLAVGGRLAILSIRRLSLKLFAKILIMSGHDAACASVNSLALALAATMKAKGVTDVSEALRSHTLKTPKKRYSDSDSDSDSDGSSSDSDGGGGSSYRTPPRSFALLWSARTARATLRCCLGSWRAYCPA